MQRSTRDRILAAFGLAIFALTAWLWLSPGGLRAAPEVALRTLDGRTLVLSELRGRPVLITFWATSCVSCVKEIPDLMALYEDYSQAGLEIIAVAMAYDPPNAVVEMARRRQIPYPISLDLDGSLARAFRDVSLTPTHFLIDPQGTIVQHKIGELDMDRLRQRVAAWLSGHSGDIG